MRAIHWCEHKCEYTVDMKKWFLVYVVESDGFI